MSHPSIPPVDSPEFITDAATEDFLPLDGTMALKFIEGLTIPMMHPATPDDRPVVGHVADENNSAVSICMTQQVMKTWQDCRRLLGYDLPTAMQVSPAVVAIISPAEHWLIEMLLVTLQESAGRKKAQDAVMQQSGMAGKSIQENRTPEESQAMARGVIEFVRVKAATIPEAITYPEDYEDMKIAIRADSAFQWLMEFADQRMEGVQAVLVLRGIISFINAMKALDEDKRKEVVDAFMGAYKPVVFAR
ncbi:hypothetical protein E6O75_ATG04928 [Venturia nashicola]|uniref:Uncharacterized protein n=1 Tax=Venturia nashicola TaxID=86259 RepID=A0A4Z1P2B0_9PEZI|nr:hypothetical protein E6O75_ATG04928 [Venturia nashicola]